MRTKHLVICVILVLAMSLGALTGIAAPKFKCGLSLPTMNIFYDPLAKAVVDAVAKAGGTTIITDAQQYKVAKELANIEDMLQQKIDVLIIDASDSVASGPAINACTEAGVPVVGLNQRVKDTDMVSVVSADNYMAGRLAAEFVMKQIKYKGKVAIIDGPPVTAVMDRIKAYKDVIEKYSPGVKLVAQQIMGNTLADGTTVAENMLQANPDLAGFLGMNDSALVGANIALENAGKAGKVAIGAVDGSPDACALITSSKATNIATAAQYPAKIGAGAVQAYLDYKAGKVVPTAIQIAPLLITKRNSKTFHW